MASFTEFVLRVLNTSSVLVQQMKIAGYAQEPQPTTVGELGQLTVCWLLTIWGELQATRRLARREVIHGNLSRRLRASSAICACRQRSGARCWPLGGSAERRGAVLVVEESGRPSDELQAISGQALS